MATELPLYQELESKLAGLIRAGTFPPGSRFPSVRHTSREHRVSISTVTEAYRRLEDGGLIEARPRSGYFVAPPRISEDRFPTTAARSSKPMRIERDSAFDAIMEVVGDPAFVRFGSATPGDDVVPELKIATLTREVMRKQGAAALRYTPPQGRRELRAALSRRAFDLGLNATPDQIVTTQGGTEAVLLALRVATRPGDLVAVETPSYFGTLHLVRDLGLRVIEIPVDARSGMVVGALAAALKKHRITACIVQPHFHNPIGSLMPEPRKHELAALADQHDFTIIEDDVYGDLAHDGQRPSSIAAHSDRVIHCGSVSKTIAPGLRVGWLIPGRHLDEIRRRKGVQNPWNSTLSELVVASFLDAGGYDRHLRRIRKLYADQCAKTREAVLRHFPDCARVNQPAGGFVLWVEMPEGFDSEAFTSAAMERRISIAPGTIFSASGNLNHCFRLACGFTLDTRAVEAVATLGKLANRLLKSAP
jgi:DNA-binding transcriptional MocR family regulator